MSGWSGRWCRCWRRMEQRGISIDRQILSPAVRRFRAGRARGSRRKSTARRRTLQHRLAQAARRYPVRQAGPAGRHRRPRPAQWSTSAPGAGRPRRRRPRTAAQDRRLAPADQAEIDLHRCAAGYIHPETGRVHTSYALAATTTGRLSSSEPNLQNIPVRTEEGRKIRTAFIAEQGPQAGLRRLQPDRAARARPCRRYPAAAAGLCRRARHPRHDRVGNVRRAGRGHAGGSPPPRQGDQFRHHLRHLRLRPRQPAVDPARGGRRLHQDAISSASPASGTTWTRPRPTPASTAMSRPSSAAASTTRRSAPPTRPIRAFNERASINAPLQGTAADIIRRAMVRMDDALDEAGLSARMLLQVHDELIFEAAEEEVERIDPGDQAGHGERAAAGGRDVACRCRSMRAPPTIGTRRTEAVQGRGGILNPRSTAGRAIMRSTQAIVFG